MIIKAQGYDIILQNNSISRAGDYFSLDRKAIIITDTGVPAGYSQAVLKCCGKGSFIKTIPMGENSKSFEVLEDILASMLENSFGRSDCVVAVGGGVVGDISGFAASVYMRGIDFYNIPTTVLSQVDSSVGGKTAINFCGVKNTVGSFYRPKGVLIDTNVLSTLPQRQINNGLAEAVKMSLTNDESLFNLFENENPYENLGKIIENSIKTKLSVVNKDEKEAGLRRVLNFGHTIGHGIEADSAGNLYHGECVALGMIPMCSDEVRSRLIPVLEKLSLPTVCEGNTGKIYEAMLHDKKATGDYITVTFVDKPGSFRFEKLSPARLRERITMAVKEKK
ncbi:MAG: 3-dehydroquinate synthase [Clostridia bacterium]|nr:3-dehydroquinate synthase [Clostridia bacterium]